MKRILITGASGFVGRHCLRPLQERGYEIHAVHRSPKQYGLNSSATWHQCDLLDRDATERTLKEVKPTHLLHLAWYAVPGRYWQATENITWLQCSLDLLRGF